MTLSFSLLPSPFFLLPSFFLLPHNSFFLLPQMATEAPVSIDSCDAWKSWGGLSRDDFTTTQSSGVEAKAATAFELRAMVRGAERGAERGAGRGTVKIAGIMGSSTVVRSNPNLAFGVQAGLCREAAAFLVFNLEVIRRITVLVIESIDGLRLRLLLQVVPVPVQSVQSDSSRKPIKPLSGPCGFVYSAANYLLKIPSDLDFLTKREEEEEEERNNERDGEIIETVETTIKTFGESSVQTSKLTASKRQKHPPSSQPPSSQKQRRREARQERERLAQAARVEARLKGAFRDVVGDWMGEGVGGEGRKGGAGGAGGGRGSIGRNPFVLRSSCSLILHRYISQKVLYCIM